MTLSMQDIWGADTYRAVAIPLVNGIPAATGPTVFEGYELDGIQDFVPNNINPRAITLVAQGRVKDTIYLPSLDAVTAVLHSGYDQPDLMAAIQDVKKRTLGGVDYVPHITNKQGVEPDFAFFVQQLVSHQEDGTTMWHTYIIPKGRILPQLSPFNQNAGQYTYNMSLSKTKKNIFGEPLDETNYGATEATIIDAFSPDIWNIVFFKADGYEGDFLVPTGKQISDLTGAKIFDFSGGTEITTGLTVDATGYHFSGGNEPEADLVMAAVYQYA